MVIIDKEVSSGVIKDRAKQTFDSYRKAHSDYIDNILEKQKKEKDFKELNFKENNKTHTAKLKEAGLKESVYKKVVSAYSKRNDKGEFALLDKLREALNKPEENHELILHLTDKKLFNDAFKIKSAQETQKTIVRLASSSKSTGNKKTIKSDNTDKVSPWQKYAEIHNSNLKK